MSLFRRSEPLHVKLAREGGLLTEETEASPHPWDAAGIHGLHRTRVWDVVTTAEAPNLTGERAAFIGLPDAGVVRLEGDGDLEPLAAALGRDLSAPYHAEAARQDGTLWAVGGRTIETVRLPGIAGDELELATHDGERTLVVDGQPVFGSVPALERPEHVVRAQRIVDDLWEVETHPL